MKENDVWGVPDGKSVEGLWHAAYNSAGQFMPALDIPKVLESVEKLLTTIDRAVKSGTSGSTISGRLQSGNSYFRSEYELLNLTGDIKASVLDVDDDTVSFSDPLWSAAELVNNKTFFGQDRLLFTYNPTQKQAVQLTANADVNNILTDQQRSRVFPNLTGRALASAFSDFSSRLLEAPLSTFVHSTPIAVIPPNRIFPEQLPQFKAYSRFKNTHKDRPTTVYAGSNGGLLHGFDGKTGKEVFAYLPDLVLEKDMRTQDVAIQSRVDGPMLAADVFFNDANTWKTVLMSGLGQGGKGYFALDVTNPRDLSAAELNNKVLWEFKGDDDLGKTFAKPAVGLMANNRWVAVFGNGYNSDTGNAVLYFVDVETGKLIKKITTGHNAAHDPKNLDRRNGLAEPALVDLDLDGIIDRIYVGDYFGNLFNIDVTSSNASQWGSTYGSDTLAKPLFSTGGQPITNKPGAVAHPTNGIVVLFGTGQLIAAEQNTGDNAIFGIYDAGKSVITHSTLVQHVMSSTTSDVVIKPGKDVADPQGWMIEFKGILSQSNVITAPKIQNGQVSFVSVGKSSTAVCSEPTYYSSILTVDALTGRSLGAPVFLDDDGKSIRRNNQNVDGIVSNSQYLDTVILGNGNNEVFLTTDGNGNAIIVNKSPSLQARRQTYWMRLVR